MAADDEDSGPGKEGGHFSAVGFSYGQSEEQQQPPEEEPFVPRFAIPEGLAIPEGMRQHKVNLKS